MATFLEAAFQVLSKVRKPLSARDLVAIAVEQKLLESVGQTPWHTMEAALSLHILQNKANSPFMRTSKGRFVLRSLADHYPEYVAKRLKRGLLDEDIAVIEAADLFRYIPSPGLVTEKISPQRLLAECKPVRRSEAEKRFDVIQLVSFYVVRHSGCLLTYRRTKRLPESRLHGFYSIGFGGHLQIEDIPVLLNFADPDLALLQITRELEEELILSSPPQIVFRGLLYDTSREVSKQHVGLVYDVHLSSAAFSIGERGFLIDAKYETINEIIGRIHDFENWSAIVARQEASRL